MWYIVGRGDTINSISNRFKVSIRQLAMLNVLADGRLYIGQKILIPNRESREFVYTVQTNDTLSSIAKLYNTTVDKLIKINKLKGPSIDIGQQLIIDEAVEAQPVVEESVENVVSDMEQIDSVNDVMLDRIIPVWRVPGKLESFFFISKMAVTADGAPNAYSKDNSAALDFLSNAGSAGNWWSLATDTGKPSGTPLEQKGTDPVLFISQTYLADCSKPDDDITKYVNANKVPYFALPAHNLMGATIGDFGAVVNVNTNKVAYAILADVGPDDELGIGSMALARALDIDPSPKSGGIENGVMYIVFPGTGAGPCKLRTIEEINREGQRYFEQWGGMAQVDALRQSNPGLFSFTAL
ncbi:MAG: LysM peptidoglycan-binding domain-containing protein [Clostridia bacterium]|nr:LysM peptidoglycan-binding domain-containing protein [Clostridia bacterium]